MHTENSEKKIELVIKPGTKSLKVLPKTFWEEMVEKAGARILSSVSSPLCDSYLLSESSLFVFPQKFLLITAGQLSLLPVVQQILAHFSLDDIDSLFYEFKSEYQAGAQSKAFFQDTVALSALMPGAAFTLSNEGSQQIALFHLDRPAQNLRHSEATLEVLAYELSPAIRSIFEQEKSRARKWISDSPTFRALFDSFDILDYSYQPYGYSLNGIKGDKFFTFHIPPRERGGYASFETNCVEVGVDALVQAVHTLFKPKYFQVLSFSPDKPVAFPSLQKFLVRAHAERRLSNGFMLQYFNAMEANAFQVIEDMPLPPFAPPAKEIEVQHEAPTPEHPAQDWIVEKTDQLMLGARIKEKLFHEKSEFQDIQIFSTEVWGNVLVCDGLIVCAERDEANYHEMIAHVPLFVHPNPYRVLILGGADLATAREVLKHPSVQECVCVEADQVLVDACKRHFAWTAKVVEDPRFTLTVQDPPVYVADGEQQFDLILIESTKTLFKDEKFLDQLRNILAPGGVIVCQADSPIYYPAEQGLLRDQLAFAFSKVVFYNFSNISYPGGLWSFVFASENYHPLEDFDREKAQKSVPDLKYYNSEIHFGAFFLPTFMRKNLYRAPSTVAANADSNVPNPPPGV